MEVLWAPWRMEYILGNKTQDCIFCVEPDISDKDMEDRLILYTGSFSMVMMNRYPYNNGHLLVAPMSHKPTLDELDQSELTDIMELTRVSMGIIKNAMNPDGFNVGINVGRVAGAGIDQHLHIHIVPRWAGDTNYMCVVSQTRVMPEHLIVTYRKLAPYFRVLDAGGTE